MADTVFYNYSGKKSIREIARIAEAELVTAGKENELIENICSIESAGSEDLCFFYDRKNKDKAAGIKAKACISTAELAHLVPEGVIILTCSNPKLSFIRLISAFYSEHKPVSGITESATVAKTAKIGKGCFIGPHAVVEDDVTIGDNCIIEANAVISRGCKIGNNCRIGNNASIAYCLMGNDCYIYTGARIGQDGFGFPLLTGSIREFPKSDGLLSVMMLKSEQIPALTEALWTTRLSGTAAVSIIWCKLRIMTKSGITAYLSPKRELQEAARLAIMSCAEDRRVLPTT